MKVYLAGPITGLSYGEAVDWRQDAIKRLNDHNIVGLSPLRSKQYLSQTTSFADRYDEYVLSTQKGIVARDRWDATRCDVILVNLEGAERVSIGSVMEIAWADAHRIPIVLVLDEGNLHDHAMVREVAGFIVPTLDAGLEVVIALSAE